MWARSNNASISKNDISSIQGRGWNPRGRNRETQKKFGAVPILQPPYISHFKIFPPAKPGGDLGERFVKDSQFADEKTQVR